MLSGETYNVISANDIGIYMLLPIASLETTRHSPALSYLTKQCERLTTMEIEVVGLVDGY